MFAEVKAAKKTDSPVYLSFSGFHLSISLKADRICQPSDNQRSLKPKVLESDWPKKKLSIVSISMMLQTKKILSLHLSLVGVKPGNIVIKFKRMPAAKHSFAWCVVAGYNYCLICFVSHRKEDNHFPFVPCLCNYCSYQCLIDSSQCT